MRIKNLKINAFGKLELAKKDNKGNYIPNTSFKISETILSSTLSDEV